MIHNPAAMYAALIVAGGVSALITLFWHRRHRADDVHPVVEVMCHSIVDAVVRAADSVRNGEPSYEEVAGAVIKGLLAVPATKRTPELGPVVRLTAPAGLYDGIWFAASLRDPVIILRSQTSFRPGRRMVTFIHPVE